MSTYYDGDCGTSRESLRAWGCLFVAVFAFWACALGFVAHWLWNVAR